MKLRILFICASLLLLSCGSSASVDRFYNQHKDDDQVLAIRVPRVMLSFLAGVSPEMERLVGNTKDMRYMRFSGISPQRSTYLNRQMSTITGNSFVEVFRKNDELKRNVISIREKRNTVREILVYTNNNFEASFLYINGEFDPAKIREMADNESFGKIQDNLFNKYSPGIIPPSE